MHYPPPPAHNPCRPAHALHFAVYEYVKEGLGGNRPGHHVWATAAAGAAATIMNDGVMNPCDVVKQRLQVRPGRPGWGYSTLTAAAGAPRPAGVGVLDTHSGCRCAQAGRGGSPRHSQRLQVRPGRSGWGYSTLTAAAGAPRPAGVGELDTNISGPRFDEVWTPAPTWVRGWTMVRTPAPTWVRGWTTVRTPAPTWVRSWTTVRSCPGALLSGTELQSQTHVGARSRNWPQS